MAKDRIAPHIFRAYDIRGLSQGGDDDEITTDTARAIGRAMAAYLRELPSAVGSERRRRVAVGWDNRPTSESLSEALSDGLRTGGADVSLLGLAPSPLTYFTVYDGGFDGGVSVTASHNSIEFNGFKLLREEAMPLLPNEIARVQEIADSIDLSTLPGSRDHGTVDMVAPYDSYIELLRDRFTLARPLRIVVDPGNGVATLSGPRALEALGAEVVGLYTDLVSGYPNHLPNPQDASTMIDLASCVVSEEADLGFAWDGDGDRVGLVDERGVRYEADWTTALIARDVLTRHPGARILCDMKTSRSPLEDIRAHGGVPVLARTGYSTFRRQMRDEQIVFGGEVSGHLMFGEDYPYIDDGVYAACVIANLIAAAAKPLSAHFLGMRRLVTSPELTLPCSDHDKFRVAAALAARFRDSYQVSEVDGARIEFPDGWTHVRASNTTPHLSVRIEAETLERFREIRDTVFEALREHDSVTIPDGVGEPQP